MIKKLMLLTFSTVLLAGCGIQGEPSIETSSETSSVEVEPSNVESSETPITHSAVLKKAGDDVLDYMGANRTKSVKRALDNLDGPDKVVYLQLPATLLYVSGLLSEIDGIDIESKLFEFGGDYEYKIGPEWVTWNITFAINVDIQEENNKIVLTANQTMKQGAITISDSDVFVDVDFDFEENKVNSFELYMDQMSDYAYVKVENNEGKIRKSDTALTPEEATKYDGEFAALKAAYETIYAERVTSTASNNKACMKTFVDTQLYINELIDQDLPIRIKE